MLSVREALNKILADFATRPPERIPLRETLGRTLVGEVMAANDLPHFDNSAMDGYAVRFEDVQHLPARLRLVGAIPAGSLADFLLQPGQAARIMTGAALPDGAELVIPIEDTDQNHAALDLPEFVKIRRGGAVGDHVRQRGEDVKQGEKLLSAGHVLRPQDLGLLAGLGIAQVDVVRKPRVALLSTGDELLAPDQPLQPGKIRDMNSYSLPAMVASLNAEAIFIGTAQDTFESVRGLLNQAVDAQVDLIISSAGVSVGTHDVVKAVLEELGAIGFWRVNMRPGKPLAYGQVRGIPFLGLPGNPVSALASFEIFVRPTILKMLGQPVDVPEIDVIVGEDMSSDGRESYIRVILERRDGQLIATSTGTQSSGAISSLVKASALLIIPEGIMKVKSGDKLKVRPFAGQSLF